MRLLRVSVALGAAAVGIATGGVQAQTCAVPAKTLSMSCGTSCVAYEPCMLKSGGSSSCDLECIVINSAARSSYSSFTFLIPYDNTVGDTGTTASRSDSALSSIAKLKLPGSTNQVNIRGGSTLVSSTRGYVANVDITSDFLSGNLQLLTLYLVNLNLGSSMDQIASNLPLTLTFISLQNTMITAFPTDITRNLKVQYLVLSTNFLTRIDASHSISQLRTLLAVGNDLTSFTAVYPLLQYLDLAYNNLPAVPAVIATFSRLTTLHLSGNPIGSFKQGDVVETLENLGLFQCNLQEFDAYFPNLVYLNLELNNLEVFPSAIFKHASLRELYLTSNPISNTKLTNAQANFIKTLDKFSIDSGAFSSDCDTSQKVPVRGFTVCITGGEVDKQVIDAGRAPTPAAAKTSTPKKTSTKSPSSSGQTATTTDDEEPVPEAEIVPTPDPDSASAASGDPRLKTTKSVGGTVSTASKSTDSSTVSDASGSNSESESSTSGTNSKKSKKDAGSVTSTIYENSTAATSTAAIVGYVAGGLAVIVIAVLLILRKKRRNRKSLIALTNTMAGTGTSFGSKGSYVSVWNDPNLLAVKVRSEDIEDVEKIGQGAFCEVWLVTYRGSQQLASKRLREVTRHGTRAFTQEIKLVTTLKHPCVVSFVGAAWTQEADLQALFEYMGGGDLRTYLVNGRTPRSWTLEKVEIAISIVEALVYVHSFSPPLVHRDLKSRNVLLSEEMTAKLTDFGVSRYQSEQNTMTAGVGTVKWLAPEVISGQSDYGPAADIYSFGAVLSELDTHKLPYDGVRGIDGYKLADIAILELVTTGEIQPEFLSTCPTEISQLAARCLSLRPEDRLTALEVAYALRTFRQSSFRAAR
ncbi:Tkl protein kinase [Globisporangium polare]